MPGIRFASAEQAVTVFICSSVKWWMWLPWRPVGGRLRADALSNQRGREQKGSDVRRYHLTVKPGHEYKVEKHLRVRDRQPLSAGLKIKTGNTQTRGTTEETSPNNPTHEGQD